MKNISKLISMCLVLALALASCKKDEQKDYFEGGTAPVLAASTAAVSLSYANAANEAIRFNWTNPNYRFTTGISSQDVFYTLEIDTTGSNFTNPGKQSIAINKDLALSISVGQMNSYLLNQLQLQVQQSHNLEARIKSALTGNSVVMMSNVVKFTATPYAIPPKVTPPASGELYITGSAVPSSWTNSPPPSQKFTKVSNTLYEITVPLTGNNSYTFLPTFGSWSDKYSIAVKNDPNEIWGGDFQWQGEDILAPPQTGTYKISVDFQRGKFTVTKQ